MYVKVRDCGDRWALVFSDESIFIKNSSFGDPLFSKTLGWTYDHVMAQATVCNRYLNA